MRQILCSLGPRDIVLLDEASGHEFVENARNQRLVRQAFIGGARFQARQQRR